MTLIHHELCFGCGRANLFGLLFDGSRAEDGAVVGRWFVKQDHQGPEPGVAHPGLVTAALVEAMTLAGGDDVTLLRIEVEVGVDAAATVGSFCELRARICGDERASIRIEAVASAEDQVVARASGEFARVPTATPRESAA